MDDPPQPQALSPIYKAHEVWHASTWRRSPEKRDRERVEILGELHGEIMVFQPLSIRRLAAEGASSKRRFRFISILHDIRLTLGELSVVLKGRVAHCRISDVDQEIVHYRSGSNSSSPLTASTKRS